jgi:phosphonopyruvate decarboxylase
MIRPSDFLRLLKERQLDFFAGVPDSRLRDFCTCLEQDDCGTICANEGNAIATTAGYYLSTGRAGVCYFQNSGLGNAFNPLVSLAHSDVYAIPMLLLIGWRGEPGVADEPQHLAQGKITLPTLDLLGIGYAVLPDNIDEAERAVSSAVNQMNRTSSPFALVVKKGTFEPYPQPVTTCRVEPFTREAALKILVSALPESARMVATTGKLSRELFEFRAESGEDHCRDFLTVGSMGHASSIALGIAAGQPLRPIVCLDGDGAALMHMGAMATIGENTPNNFAHVLFNNGVHESVGGQPTCSPDVDFCAVAVACGYRSAAVATKPDEVSAWAEKVTSHNGPAFLEIRIASGSRDDLGRPTSSPQDNKTEFMNGCHD